MSKKNFDFVAIDTNVFEHLLNPQNNSQEHITKLLTQLICCYDAKLIVDTGGRIIDEYENRLLQFMEQHHDNNEDILLRYWFNLENHCLISIEKRNELMRNIRSILPRGAETDCIFVYVAFKKGKVLITNDRKDIIDEGTQTNRRRNRLLKIKGRTKGSYILTSEEAWAHIA